MGNRCGKFTDDITQSDIGPIYQFSNFIPCLIATWIIAIIVCQIFSNLFRFKTKWICNLIPIPTIIFSNKYESTWIIEPSPANKIHAISAATFMCLTYFTRCIQYIAAVVEEVLGYCHITPDPSLDYERYYEYWIQTASEQFRIIGHTFYFLYLLSTLKYHMKQSQLIESMISKKCIVLVKICIIFNLLLFIASSALWIYLQYGSVIIDGIPFLAIKDLVSVFIKIMMEFSLFSLYFNGFNNVAHYWYRERNKEYKKYGTNMKVHEILLTITRCSVLMIISIVCGLISHGYLMFLHMYVYPKQDTVMKGVFAYPIFDAVCMIFNGIDDISYSLSIYWMYPFGHREYEFILGCCHRKMYKYCERKHDKSFKKDSFDGKTYRDIWCLCCTKSRKDVIRNNNEKKHSVELKICSCFKRRKTSDEITNDYNCMIQNILNENDDFMSNDGSSKSIFI